MFNSNLEEMYMVTDYVLWFINQKIFRTKHILMLSKLLATEQVQFSEMEMAKFGVVNLLNRGTNIRILSP